MPISMYDVTIANHLQQLAGVAGFLAKGRAHIEAAGLDIEAVLEARLISDMNPFSYQVFAVKHHTVGALAGLEAGSFSPPPPMPQLDYQGLQDMISEAHKTVGTYTKEQVNAWDDRDILFVVGERQVPFKAQDFVMSFSLPNLYFHATTAYDILRQNGVPIGKRDFSGPLRIKH